MGEFPFSARTTGIPTTSSAASLTALPKSLPANGSDMTRSYCAVPLVMEGVITFARMPSRFASMASPRVNIMIPAMAAPITLSPGVGIFPASEARLMIAPRFAARM